MEEFYRKTLRHETRLSLIIHSKSEACGTRAPYRQTDRNPALKTTYDLELDHARSAASRARCGIKTTTRFHYSGRKRLPHAHRLPQPSSPSSAFYAPFPRPHSTTRPNALLQVRNLSLTPPLALWLSHFAHTLKTVCSVLGAVRVRPASRRVIAAAAATCTRVEDRRLKICCSCWTVDRDELEESLPPAGPARCEARSA